MIERLHTARRMSKIVKHNGVVYLCGQVGEGATIEDQTRDCLTRIDALSPKRAPAASASSRRRSGSRTWATSRE